MSWGLILGVTIPLFWACLLLQRLLAEMRRANAHLVLLHETIAFEIHGGSEGATRDIMRRHGLTPPA